MATIAEPFQVLFPDWYDARAEFESPMKGHLSGVQVQLADGATCSLTFYDPVRLQQALEDDARTGRAYFTEPGLVVLPEVTTNSVRTVVEGLYREGFFQHLKPLEKRELSEEEP